MGELYLPRFLRYCLEQMIAAIAALGERPAEIATIRTGAGDAHSADGHYRPASRPSGNGPTAISCRQVQPLAAPDTKAILAERFRTRIHLYQ